jgi:predicted nucleic acid-binding protein
MEALGARTASAVTSVSVIEELCHQELRGRLPGLDGVADAAFILMRPVLALTDEIVAAAFDLEVRGLGANDRIHVATCHANGIETVLTADRGFDAAPGLRRVDPPISPRSAPCSPAGRTQRPRSRRMRRAALCPAAPMTEPAGWQPAAPA